MTDLQPLIEAAWNDRSLLQQPTTIQAIEHVIEELDKGRLRVAQPAADREGGWLVNDWVK